MRQHIKILLCQRVVLHQSVVKELLGQHVVIELCVNMLLEDVFDNILLHY